MQVAAHRTLHTAWSLSEAGWQLYPVYAVDDGGVCNCSRGTACTDPGKHPTTPHGFNDASSDPERIADMFARWPGDNVGHKSGRASGTVIIDVDPRDGGMETLGRLQAEHGYLPPTRLHATGGGGFHYVLGYPEGVKELPSRTIGPGVEVKADGAGVVLPPSIHASGERYEVLIDAPLAPLPSWVAELVRELRVLAGGAEQPTESRFKLPENIYETASPRNRTLFDYGCSLRAHGWDHAAILAELRRVNAERCIPPMADYEVQKIARSVARYQPGNALTVSPEVLAAVAYLEERAGQRAKKGLAATWSCRSPFAASPSTPVCPNRLRRTPSTLSKPLGWSTASPAGMVRCPVHWHFASPTLTYPVHSYHPSPLLLYRPRQCPRPFTGSGTDRGASASQRPRCWRRWWNVPA
jgi:hypothetical protein